VIRLAREQGAFIASAFAKITRDTNSLPIELVDVLDHLGNR